MKVLLSDLLEDIGTINVYDKTKTTPYGRVYSHTTSGIPVLSPPVNTYADFFTDTGITPTAGMHVTDNGRMFLVSTVSSGVAGVVMYSMDFATGAFVYVGRIAVTLPNQAATTHTIRSLKVYDSGTTNWRIFIGSTGSVSVNGGIFMVNKVNLVDFTPILSVTFPMASNLIVTGSSTTDAKAVYMLQDPAAHGATNAQTSNAEIVLDYDNLFVYNHNGSAATHQYYKYNFATAPQVNLVQAVTSFTIASPGKVNIVGHGYSVNDQVLFGTTGTLPTGITAGTVYFVRNPTANDFEISTTSGGGSINFSGAPAGTHTVARAFGQSSNTFTLRTLNLPALTGTLLQTNSGYYAEPVNCPANPALQGLPCAFSLTSSNAYMGLLSELTSLTTTWPSLTTVNLLGSSNEIISPTATHGVWSSDQDNFIYVTNTSTFVAKDFQSNVIKSIYGGVSNQYLEAMVGMLPDLGVAALSSIDTANGWVLISGTTTGQRVVVASDIRSDYTYEYSKIITKLLTVNSSQAVALATIESIFDFTSTMVFSYRTGAASDVTFNTDSSGWVQIGVATDLTSITFGEVVQFKIEWNNASIMSSSPAQIAELLCAINPLFELSDYWEYSHDFSDTGTPTRCVFRLKQAYSVPVPNLRFLASDLTNVTIVNHTTALNSAQFEYSTDDGTSWNGLGTIPNTVGTLLRYTFAVAPGVDIRPAIQEADVI